MNMIGRATRRVGLRVSVAACFASGCNGPSEADTTVRVDTLASGHVVVTNGRSGLWKDGEAWQVFEELRIGSVDAEGPESFGRITSIAADASGRVFVLEGQASELRVFDAAGHHVRTIGRQGQGPGEFLQPVRVDISPDDEVWVMDPRNARLAVFDSSGTFLTTRSFGGGFVVMPWRGGFDRAGRYHSPITVSEPEFRIAMAVLDSALVPIDTLIPPRDPVERKGWYIEQDGRTRAAAGVPFQGRLVWELTRSGTIWALVTDQYRLFELSADGDTLRSSINEREPVPVSDTEVARAIEGLSWFTDQGGRIDPSMIPSHKPAVSWFFIDDLEHIWVSRTPPYGEEASRFDVFDPQGRYLGSASLPFALSQAPAPFVLDGALYGVTRDEYDVQYVVRAAVERG